MIFKVLFVIAVAIAAYNIGKDTAYTKIYGIGEEDVWDE